MDIRKLWKLFLYAGVEKEEYNKLRPSIHEENKMLLNAFSQLAAGMFFLLYIASIVTRGFAANNSMTYMLSTIQMLIILFCVRFVLPKRPAFVMLLVYIFEITLYAFGVNISMLHADKPAVSAVTFLMVSPLLFYDRPVRLSAMIAAVVSVFCGIVARFKAADVAETDIWNAVTFGVVAIVATVFIMSIKIRALSQSRQIQYMSQTDLLTGVKNRNQYENQLNTYPGLCTSNIICVYADVNGLHEMNNKNGHFAGDRMLREVAEVMKQCFGQEHTYRIGGDEFVAFRADGQLDDMLAEVSRMKQELQEKGYYVSYGTAIREKSKGELNMDELVGEAESNMFADKRLYYSQAGHDRRSR